MAAAPVHYIRTIHTSFTAAHPHSSSAWASHASTSAVARTHAHSTILLNLTGSYNNAPPPSKYPPGLGATTGRKRSASIRVAPPAYAQRMQPQRVKFDPFAEESEPLVQASSVLYNTPHHQTASRTLTTRPASIPYTIHIPPAAPADIQRHQKQQQQYRHQHEQVRVRVRPQSPAPVQRVSTPVVVATPNATANAVKEREARSKIVAGILLNRVHAVGKPMRRRSSDQPRPYVPSGLSTCISIEA
ncbi:hypothetical protein P691DRAFT_793662 [Macrolepiota fuliginosa MF-IS2]|uniref:Uncharacterized protein n=1 Tax=Macrolepiota fuliginosa MF-IS2 TaxID=1400762 RepID=A0A9P6C310_9AGAR|nr:hypothetical protein P691DRAFT_793662 [Macrolepiota fuliginosa MF-IS2]